MIDPLLEQFLALLACDSADIDLAGAALLIARQAYPDLPETAYLHRLDQMAEELKERLDPDYTPMDTMLELNQYLYSELGFAGNREDYYDPRNSFLNDVLDRRLGIPITLALVYLEVGRRVGLELTGVAFPGHFLVKLQLNEEAVVIDPFDRGATLSPEDLEERAERVLGADAPLRSMIERILEPADKREMLLRMLRNLKAIYMRQEEHQRALRVIQWLLACEPQNVELRRDRGLVYQALECARPALADLRRYLEAAPGARDAEEIRTRVIDLQRAVQQLN